MKAALATLLIISVVTVSGQELDESDLSKLAGEWTGSLTYTDYGDDKSKEWGARRRAVGMTGSVIPSLPRGVRRHFDQVRGVSKW